MSTHPAVLIYDIGTSFYEQLLQFIQDVLSHEVLCVIGDLNGHVGNDSEGCARSHGRKGVVTSTRMATDSCASQIDHVIMSSLVSKLKNSL